MKKICVCLLFCLCVSLCSCEPVMSYMTEEDVENYSEVSLIFYDNPDAPVHKHDSRPGDFSQYDWEKFDESKMEVLEVLPAEKAQALIDKMIQHECFYDFQHINAPDGYSLRILYKNGDFYVQSLTANRMFAARYNSRGELIKVYGRGFVTVEVINSYFNHQVPTDTEKQ